VKGTYKPTIDFIFRRSSVAVATFRKGPHYLPYLNRDTKSNLL